jgi:endonuclease YncB( thermonuclease family)
MRWIALLLVLAAHGVPGETLQGRVVRIADGDTLTIVDSREVQHKIRLAGVDAPERKQQFYDASRQNLAALAFDKTVTVEWHKRDRYGRLVGKVLTGGEDAGLAQVRAGLAWWFREYAHEQSGSDRARYEAAELEARAARRGLWQALAVAPWEWRARNTAPSN